MSEKNKLKGFSTRAIHHGYDPYAGHGALNPPLHMSSTYTFPTVEDGSERFAGDQEGFVYSRVGNPTTCLLERRIADLEGGEAALVTASGMGATASLLWTLLQPGDEIIADTTLYGCTYAYFNEGLARFGVKITHVDLTNPANLTPTCVWWTSPPLPESPEPIMQKRWSTTPTARPTCNAPWNSARIMSCTPPPNTSADTAT